MKRLFILMLGCGLLMLGGVAALGAVHDTYGDFVDPTSVTMFASPAQNSFSPQAIHDSFVNMGSVFSPFNYGFTKEYWYGIEPQDPFFQAVGNSADITNRYAVEYWKGDFSFSEYSFTTTNINITCARASYLDDSGWFFGAQYAAFGGSYMQFSPGYRWEVGENGFVALSLDYLISDAGPTIDKDILGYDVDYKFYTEKMKFFGQLYWNALNDAGYYDFALNYRFSPSFVLGGQIALYDGEEALSIGFTWNKEKFVLDAMFEQVSPEIGADYNVVAGSFLYDFSKTFALGFAWYNNEAYPDNGFGIKAKYVLEGACGGELNLGYLIPTDNVFPQAISLRYIKYL